MNISQARKLKIGDRLSWWNENKLEVLGTVIEIGYNAFKVKWDDDVISLIHFSDESLLSSIKEHIGG